MYLETPTQISITNDKWQQIPQEIIRAMNRGMNKKLIAVYCNSDRKNHMHASYFGKEHPIALLYLYQDERKHSFYYMSIW